MVALEVGAVERSVLNVEVDHAEMSAFLQQLRETRQHDRHAWVTSPVPAPYSSIRIDRSSGMAPLIDRATASARSTFAASSHVAALSSKLFVLTT
jgi:hypothetical protein